MTSTSPSFEAIAGVVIMDPHGALLLQDRDDKPGISSPGMIGMFGGHVEDGETDIACVLREVEEETGLVLGEDALELMLSMHGRKSDGQSFTGSFFFATGLEIAPENVTEGTLIRIPFREVSAHFDRLVPTTAHVVAMLKEQVRLGLRTLST